MRYLGYLLFAFVVSLTCLFFMYDFTLQNTLIVIIFCMVYYAVNAVVLLNTLEIKMMGNIFALILAFNYAVSCYVESFLLGLPLLFLIVLLFIKKYHFTVRILTSGILVILLLSFLIYKAILPSINIKEMNKVFNSDGDIAVVSFPVDTGATGIDYKYKAQKIYFGSLVRVDKTLKLSNKYVDVQWINSNFSKIGDDYYKIWFP